MLTVNEVLNELKKYPSNCPVRIEQFFRETQNAILRSVEYDKGEVILMDHNTENFASFVERRLRTNHTTFISFNGTIFVSDDCSSILKPK